MGSAFCRILPGGARLSYVADFRYRSDHRVPPSGAIPADGPARAVQAALTSCRAARSTLRLTLNVLELTIFSDGIGGDLDEFRDAMNAYFGTLGRIGALDLFGVPNWCSDRVAGGSRKRSPISKVSSTRSSKPDACGCKTVRMRMRPAIF
jgi:hypothetical protein